MRFAVLLLLIGTSSADFLPNGCPGDSSVHLLLRHETDCTKFYSCSNGNAILMSCGTGTAFDENIQVCTWLNQVDCSTSTTRVTPPTMSTSPITTTTTARPTTTETSTTRASTTPTSESTSTVSTPTSTTTVSTTLTPTTLRPTTISSTEIPSTTPTPSCNYQVIMSTTNMDCDKIKHCSDHFKLKVNCPVKLNNGSFKMILGLTYGSIQNISN